MIPFIDVRNFIGRKIYEGSLSFECEMDDALIDIPFVTFASPAHFELRFTISEDDAVSVRGTVSFALKGDCSRCLAHTETRIEGEAKGVFVPDEGDGEEYEYRNGKVDLNEFVRDAVMFALPSRLLCETCALSEEHE